MNNLIKELEEIEKEVTEFNEQLKVMNETISKAIKERKLYIKDRNGTKFLLSSFEDYEIIFEEGIEIYGLRELFPNCECQDF